MYRILTINPGSTSTKVGIFEDEKLVNELTLRHSQDELAKYKSLMEQYEFRKELVEKAINDNGYDLSTFSAISCRGGIIKSIPSGTYLVNEEVLSDCKNSPINHPSNLAALIGNELAKKYNLKAYITDPPTTFEGTNISQVTGNPNFKRLQRFHALNHKAIAKKHCQITGIDYGSVNLIVVHVGGGISVGIHSNGRVIDVNDAMDEGPFSPERSGSLPVFQLVEACFSGKYTKDEVRKMLRGKAGFLAYAGTNDVRDVLKRIKEGDKEMKLYFDAFVYQIAKEVGAMSTVVAGKIDGILLTGGVSYNELFVSELKERISWIGDIFVYPGEEELEALNYAVLNILKGNEEVKTY